MPRFIHLCIAFCMLLSGGQLLSQDLQSILAGSNAQLSEAQLLALNNFSIEIDTVHTDIGQVGAYDLSGFNTYRIYIKTNSPSDEVSAVYGNSAAPFHLATTTGFFQDPFGDIKADAINPLLYDLSPTLLYDSWITIGLEGPAIDSLGEAPVQLVNSTDQNWPDVFESGQSFSMNDLVGGTFFVIGSATNSVAGDDLRVLIAQVTTDGDITANIQAQIFLEGENQSGTSQVSLCGNDIDTDGDGVCDGFEVLGCQDATACNFDPAATDADECVFITDSLCESCIDGEVELLDVNGNDICDLNEPQGCTDADACNYDASATLDDGTCEFESCAGCTDSNACNYDDTATIDDGSCESLSCAGCTDSAACNYDETATLDDDSCESTSCAGCTDATACNYDETATLDDGSCESLSCAGCTDATACNYDETATLDDGSCESTSCAGCTDATACNYDADATIDDGSCESISCAGCTDATACNYDETATLDDGSCESTSCAGCTDATACNYDETATLDDGSCESTSCAGCTDAAACNYDETATLDDGSCESTSCAGCTDAAACNYDETATLDDGSCESTSCAGCTDATACNYDETATIDDGSCESLSCAGCTDAAACNYNETATLDDGSCESTSCAGCTDAAACNYDETATLDDGSCESTSCAGCTDAAACNYDETATLDDGSCESTSCAGCTDAAACNYDETATLDDGSCESTSCAGCTDAAACNYDETATLDDGSCESTSCAGCTDATACNYDETATIDDGSCESLSCAGCTDAAACNYNETATLDDGSCESTSCAGCTDATACNYDETATLDDGSCESTSCAGCTDAAACNYDETATLDDGSCESTSCAGCTDAAACNYDETATLDDGSCESTSCAGCTDAAACNYDETATLDDGSCESTSCAGCTDATACNYDETATLDDGSCESTSCAGCTDATACNYDATATIDDGSCESLSCAGCTDAAACNYNETATLDDGSCESTSCAGCTDATACNYDETATIDDGSCESLSCAGCTDAAACNYNETATLDDGSCESTSCAGCTDATACNYDETATIDDGSCESLSCAGCTDAAACNYNETATLDDGSCESTSCAGCTDATACNYDETATLDDGSCESTSCAGCTDAAACNYDETATLNDGSCESTSCAGCTDATACNYDETATLDDGSCESTSCAGCTDATACNYDETATIDDGSCTYPTAANLDCDGACLNDADEDGVCDEDEVAGCTDATACNYDAAATEDDTSCEYSSCAGCTAEGACNYDADATLDDGSCTYPAEDYLDCTGACLNDADEDGICDENEIAGCTDASACNFDAAATDDDASCIFPASDYVDCAGNCLNDADEDGICDEDEVQGCTDAEACNYDATATEDDGNCTYPAAANVDCDGNCLNDVDADGVCDELDQCTDLGACNFAADGNDTCLYLDFCGECGGDGPAPGFNCDGTLISDSCDIACIVPSASLDTVVLSCFADLQNITCDPDLTAFNNCSQEQDITVSCNPQIGERELRSTCIASTANGIGDDGAIVLFGITMYGVESTYFVPSGEGLTFEEFAFSNTASLSGTVEGVSNPNEKWQVYMEFENGVTGADWPGGFKTAMTCTPTPDITDAWNIYTLKGDQSFLVGQGDLDGSLLALNHAPSNQYFGFQVGEMANDRNCNYGAGGWFGWEGYLWDPSMEVSGANGDVLVDLECAESANQNSLSCSQTASLLYTFIDPNCSNIFQMEQVFVYDDNEAPTFNDAPADTVVYCGADLPALETLTAEDNCPGSEITVSFNGQATLPDSLAPGCYTVERSWMASDDCGNQAFHTQTIQVVDTAAPVITGGENGFGECGADNAVALSSWLSSRGGAEATDDCGEVTWSGPVMSDMASGCGTTGSTTYTFTATDACGNSASIDLSFEIVDTTPPAVTGLNSIAVACADYDENALYNIEATDACSGAAELDIVIDSAVVTTGGCGFNMFRYYSVTDACDNVTYFEQSVSLYDSIPPVITITSCPDSALLEVDDLCTADTSVATLGALEISVDDNCDNAPVETITHEDVVTSDCAGHMFIERTWTAIAVDNCDRADTVSCVQIIEVLDLVGPTLEISCPDSALVAKDENCGADTSPSALGTPAILTEDLCGGAVVIDTAYADADTLDLCIGHFSFTRTWTITATDECGNATIAECAQHIEVEDQTAPIITIEDTVTMACDLFMETELYGVSATDNCSAAELAIDSQTAGELSCAGSFLRTISATDSCGNVSTAEQVIILTDEEAPVLSITCPVDTLLTVDALCDADTSAANLSFATTEASDNCGTPEVVVTYSDAVEAPCNGSMVIVRTWSATATDACTNATTVTCLQTITVNDVSKPALSIECPSDTTVYADAQCTVALGLDDVNLPGITVSDNCDALPGLDISFVDSDTNTTCLGNYSFTRTWTVTATDDCDNDSTVTCAHTVSVEDTLAPTVTADIEVTMDCSVFHEDSLYAISATDNCSGAAIAITSNLMFSGACAGTYDRTYTITDSCGNSTTFDQFIHLTDSIAPVVDITCPAGDTLLVDLDCLADTSAANLGMAEATCTDNCDSEPETTITYSDVLTPLCVGNTLLERTWMAVGEDHCGNTDTATCVQTVLLQDLIAPELTLTCPDTATVSLDAFCEAEALASSTGEPTIETSDNCDGPVATSSSYVDSDTVATCGNAFNFTRTWTVTATDSCGNTSEASCAQLIQVVDDTAPDWSGALLYTYAACDDLTDPTDPTQVPIGAVDNCDDTLEYTITAELFSGGCPGSWERIWTATDDCGNSSSISQFVVLFDMTAPVLECPDDITLHLDAACAANLADSLTGTATASDNCSAVEDIEITYTDSLASIDCVGDDDTPEGSRTILRTFSAMDNCENVTECVQTITLLDTLAPVGTVTGDTIACELFDAATEYGSASGTDNCDSDVAYTWVEDSVLLGGCEGSYEVHRRYTFVDDCGNASEVMQTLVVVDETAPVITGDMVVIVACQNYEEDALVPYITATDNCGEVSIAITDMPFSGGCVQPAATFMREYIVSDDCGNTATFSQFVELVDTIPPALLVICPDSVELFSDAACGVDTDTSVTGMPDITAFDNCCVDIDLTTTYEDGPADTLCLGSYTFTRTFTVTAEDDCFNSTTETCTQVITVTDSLPPTLLCPENLTVECDGAGNEAEWTAWLASAEATDGCSEAVIDTVVLETDSCGPTLERLVTFTATDACNNATSCSATFTIVDTTAPEVEPASDLTVQCDGDFNDADLEGWLLDNGGATASDSCSGGVIWSNNFDAVGLTPGCGATGSATVTFTATDACGNADSTTATFTIIDTIAPVFADTGYVFSIACDLYDEDALYVVTAEDECGLSVITVESNLEGSGACPGSWIRTYLATDACENTSTFTQTINLIDTVAPTFDFVPEDYTALCSEEHPLEMATASDNCTDSVDVTVTADTTAGDCPQAYTVTRTFTAEDACGLTTEATQVITIIDTVAPTFVEALPGDTTVDCHDVPAAEVLTATDLCQEVLVIFTEDTTAGDCPQQYTLTRTWTTADACANESVHVQTVTVQDTIAPAIDTPAGDLTVECDGAGNTGAYDAWVDSLAGAAASDLCGLVDWNHAVDTVIPACDGAVATTIVTFTAMDECGNASSTTAAFMIEDTTAPTAEADSLFMVMCADYNDSTAYALTTFDGCSDVNVDIADEPMAEGPCAGAFERTYTVSDACGNDTVLTQIVHLYDSIAPVFTHVPADTTLLCNEAWNLDSLGTAMAEDNCLGSVTISYSDSVIAADSLDVDCYVVDRLWTATDVCGNEKSVTQTITIADTLAPTLTIVYPADVTLVADEDCAVNSDSSATGSPLATADDNCDLDVTIDITLTDSIAPTCGGAYELHRLWVIQAEDNCGNITTEMATQLIEVLDEGDPTLTAEAPADQTILQTPDCDVYLGTDSLGVPSYEVFDACDTNVTVDVIPNDSEAVYTCATEDSLAEGDYHFTRTFTLIATDACGNADTVEVSQMIHVLDQIAPQFTGTCDIENGSSIAACCEDHNGIVNIPDACEVSFTDNCDTEVDLTFTESTNGDYAPNDSVTRFCTSVVPEAFEDGETCNGLDPHNLRLFNLPSGGSEYYVATSPGSIEHRPDSTWVLTQSVMALDGSGGGWDIEVTYSAPMTWDEWSNQDIPTSFKRDCGDIVDDHDNWEYRIMLSGSLVGTDNYEGNVFSLMHSPANQYYAFQLGLGANNMNNNFGYSGWFTYSGTFNGIPTMGSGDLFGDMDCCLPWSIDRTYLLVDDCGNSTTFEYTVNVNGGECLGDGDAEVSGNGGTDHTPGLLGGAGDLTVGKTPIRVTNLQPNPTNDWSQLGFEVTSNMRVTITMFTMDGVLVTQLFDGIAGPGVNHSLDIPADELQSGMYQIKLSNSDYMIVKKLLVTE